MAKKASASSTRSRSASKSTRRSKDARLFKSTRQSKGGKARAKSLSPARRSEISRKAATKRWSAGIPQAIYEGEIKIGDATLAAAVLPNGQRLLTQSTFLRAIGRARTPKKGTGVLSTQDGLPSFLTASILEPFIDDKVRKSTTPIFFLTKDGRRAVGYDAELLPKVCNVYLKYRDDALATSGKVSSQYAHIVKACDLLIRGLAHVGIIALVDEATGYQYDRARDALAQILEEFVAKELAQWAKAFPDDFYKHLYRLHPKLDQKLMGNKKPRFIGKLTDDLIYKRLAPGVRDELHKRNPADGDGRRPNKHHQWLTRQSGYPKLMFHLGKIISLMEDQDDWEEFKEKLDRKLPRFPALNKSGS